MLKITIELNSTPFRWPTLNPAKARRIAAIIGGLAGLAYGLAAYNGMTRYNPGYFLIEWQGCYFSDGRAVCHVLDRFSMMIVFAAIGAAALALLARLVCSWNRSPLVRLAGSEQGPR
jgi:hypothetical protein